MGMFRKFKEYNQAVKKYGENTVAEWKRYNNISDNKSLVGFIKNTENIDSSLGKFSAEKGEVFKTYGVHQSTIPSELGNDFNNTQKKRQNLFSNDTSGLFGN